jgi:Fuc2NAc and GlcNAc transferase
MLDIPNHRTSHERPIPRGGGLSIVVVFLCSLSVMFVLKMPAGEQAALSWLLIGGFAVATVGFLDDLRDVPQAVRFTVHLGAVAFGLIVLPSLPSLVANHIRHPDSIRKRVSRLELATCESIHG